MIRRPLRCGRRGLWLPATLAAALGAHASNFDQSGFADGRDGCRNQSTALHLDGDRDGIVNRCDQDFNNDGIVDELDLAYLKAVFFKSDAVADLDGSGSVDFA
ncbi:MAG: thrombospondin type 3 repeat-containing protein, partial [Pseudomonadota bacterium]